MQVDLSRLLGLLISIFAQIYNKKFSLEQIICIFIYKIFIDLTNVALCATENKAQYTEYSHEHNFFSYSSHI
jgi:hypothetical protein